MGTTAHPHALVPPMSLTMRGVPACWIFVVRLWRLSCCGCTGVDSDGDWDMRRSWGTYYHVWGVWNILIDDGISQQRGAPFISNFTETWEYVLPTCLYFFPELKRSISYVGGLPVLTSRCSGSLKCMSLECHIKIPLSIRCHLHWLSRVRHHCN